MKQLESMIIGRTMPVMIQTPCENIKHFHIKISSVHNNHCGGCIEPRVENVFGMEGCIFFYAVLEPGDIALVEFWYKCHGKEEAPKCPMCASEMHLEILEDFKCWKCEPPCEGSSTYWDSI
jgi:hypothetical protein